MSVKYVRDTYKVPAKRGMTVMVDGQPGRIVSFPGAYIGVRFQDTAAHGKFTHRCHPTWRVVYMLADGSEHRTNDFQERP